MQFKSSKKRKIELFVTSHLLPIPFPIDKDELTRTST